MKKQSKSASKVNWREFFAGPRKWYAIVPGSLLVLVLSWVVYLQFRTIPPPDVRTVAPEDVVSFMGDARGWSQMPVPQREQFAVQMWQYYREAPAAQREQLDRSFLAMSPAQKQVMAEASIGIMKTHLLKQATQYGQLTTPQARAQFVDQSLKDFRNVQTALAGGGPNGTGVNVARGFQEVMPKDSGEVQKIIVTQSTPGERAKAEPYLDAVVQRNAEQIRETQRSRGG